MVEMWGKYVISKQERIETRNVNYFQKLDMFIGNPNIKIAFKYYMIDQWLSLVLAANKL